VLSFCNARQMTVTEASIYYSPDVFTEDDGVLNESTKEFITNYLTEFRTHLVGVLTVPSRQ
jgi:chromate reductase, NAD(P)H dehydrogenase (quinone)